MLILAAVMVAIHPTAYAEESGNLQIHIDQKVIYCAARLQAGSDAFAHALKDGIPVETIWQVQVGKVRDYWLNENIAEISVSRRVESDLLTKSWLLVDESSGISRRVFRMEEAIRFLSVLEHFPVLDRSLLLADTLYRASVSVEIHTGEEDDSWWSGLWTSTVSSMQKDFSLP